MLETIGCLIFLWVWIKVCCWGYEDKLWRDYEKEKKLKEKWSLEQSKEF